MKKKSILVLSFLTMALVVSILYFTNRKNKQEVTFITATAQYGAITNSVMVTGTLQPLDTVSVGAQVSGVVSAIYVDFNSVVTKGQLLAKMDTSIIMAEMELATADLTSARSNSTFQESNFERQEQLYDKGITSRADYEVALNQYKSAQAGLGSALTQLKILTQHLFCTNIYSPVDGVVLNRNVSAGQTIASSFNAPTLFVIGKEIGKMQVWAAVDEADIGGVKVGQKVSFNVDAFPDDTFQGTVKEIVVHPSAFVNVLTYTSLINVENTEMKLKPGMTASITIDTQQDDSAVIIPSKALPFKPDSSRIKEYLIMAVEKMVGGRVEAVKENCSKFRDSIEGTKQKEYVWIDKGDTVWEKRIRIGINEDTYVKVVDREGPDEEVITYMVNEGGGSTVHNKHHSPFMRQIRRGRIFGSSRK
jgi:HlyD family secretion protein